MAWIFISYRRDDAAGHARLLREAFSKRFGEQSVFLDLENIAPGTLFAKAIQEALSSCTVFVALIGKQWLTISDSRGRRLDNPEDFVRTEIKTAFATIASRVDAALKAEPRLQTFHIDVNVVSGVVRLSGRVDSARTAELAEELAKRASHKTISNRLSF